MGGVNKEQIEAVRKNDLLTYMQSCEPNSIIRCGNNVYKLAEHNSLKINNGKWYWFSHRFGGVSALDFLIKVRNMDFVNAVKTLIYSRAFPIIVTEPIKPLNESDFNRINKFIYCLIFCRIWYLKIYTFMVK